MASRATHGRDGRRSNIIPLYGSSKVRLHGGEGYFRTMQVAVEVCVTSVEEAVAAERAGADGVEVCSWLASGGITPSSGLVDAVRTAVRIPARVLVRPTTGGFVYGPPDIHALLLDAEIYGGGAIGLVTGALLEDGSINADLIRSVKGLAPESEITFHRAIDHSTDPMAILAACLELGVERILTSGGAASAVTGIPVLRQLMQAAGDSCQVAAAGGIDPDNVVQIVETTGVSEVHFAAQRRVTLDPGKVALSSGSDAEFFTVAPDEGKIEGVMNALLKAGLR